ncbi:MAG TPA: FKBP-type peptidyl-prolyl cis-trans isomerase [Candidatus Saccharimonadales bacterium]|nr:FKBP-type peptidyl-prolyl cis-trans isomerase [Candidatus Saccharimonadales bacterium]
MQEYKTKKSTRILIIIIAIVMAGGFLGTYVLMIMTQQEQSDPKALQSQQERLLKESQKGQTVDPNAYKVEGPVKELQIIDKKQGTGVEVKPSDVVRVHYKGTFAKDGTKFDSSYDRGEPATFAVAEVIEGWQKGIPGMKVGGERRLVIPAAMAYGETGNRGIPPNTDLVFEVELLAIVNPGQ